MANHFTVNGTSIKDPSGFKIERYNVTNMDRLANAKMVGDLIAQKQKFYFTYDSIEASELDTILGAIYTATLFFPLVYYENGVQHTKTVYVGSIPQELHKATTNAHWVWKNVTFNLIEQ